MLVQRFGDPGGRAAGVHRDTPWRDLASQVRTAAVRSPTRPPSPWAGGPDLSLQRDPDAAAIPHGRARPTVATERRIDGLAENLELRAAAVRIARPPARRRS